MVEETNTGPKVSSVAQREEGKNEFARKGLEIERKFAYEIRVQNHLDQRWTEWFDGWTITNVENNEVILTCSNADHAGLHGALDKIRDLHLALISVKRISSESRDRPPEDERQNLRRTK